MSVLIEITCTNWVNHSVWGHKWNNELNKNKKTHTNWNCHSVVRPIWRRIEDEDNDKASRSKRRKVCAQMERNQSACKPKRGPSWRDKMSRQTNVPKAEGQNEETTRNEKIFLLAHLLKLKKDKTLRRQHDYYDSQI